METKTHEYKGGRDERSGWRDEAISQWVRGLRDVPFADIDFLGITFHQLEPVAMIDWKRIQKLYDNDSWASCLAQRKVADRASLPFFIIFYSEGQTYFLVKPKNDLAHRFILEHEKRLTPRGMVSFMYSLSGRTASSEQLDTLSDEYPSELLTQDAATEAALNAMFN